jgi:hypothetical protein
MRYRHIVLDAAAASSAAGRFSRRKVTAIVSHHFVGQSALPQRHLVHAHQAVRLGEVDADFNGLAKNERRAAAKQC